MKIEILQLLEGAQRAEGLTVVIDVFRAFSTACYMVSRGAGPVYPVGTVDEAFLLKQVFPDALLVGERNEQKIAGFDFGNSPTHLLKADICGRKIIHTTSSGTRGIVNACNAAQIITGSFVNAGAIVRYIRSVNPDRVSLVCMGYSCEYPTDEDTLCAEYIRNSLTHRPFDMEAAITRIRKGSGARFFEQESQSWAPETDFDLCLDLNKFDFILKVTREGCITYLDKADI